MRRLAGTLLVMVSLPLLAAGQTAVQPKAHGYFFFAPGVTTPGSTGTAHFGGGGEGLIYKGLGVGAELGYLAPWRSFASGIGTFSPNVSYHFLPKQDRKLEPFVTGGYTLFFRSGTANGFNFGGGINYWLKDSIALRFAVRDNVWTKYATGHHVGFRIGVTFR
jgi:hypothetical protein